MALLPKSTNSGLHPINLASAKLRQSDTYSLVVAGQPKTGKTELINALVKAGLEVHHLDMDGNNMALAIGDEPNYHYYPLRNSNNSVWQAFKQLRSTHKFTACHEHGAVGCKTCLEAGAPHYLLDLMALPKRSILVTDSFTSYYRALNDSVTDHNGKDNLIISDADTAYYRTLSSAAVPVWHMLCKLPGAADSLILTHQVDRQNIMNAKSVNSFKLPLSGSGAYSTNPNSLSPATAVWATTDEPVEANRRFITKSNVKAYAFTASQAGDFSKDTPDVAIVKFFKRQLGGV